LSGVRWGEVIALFGGTFDPPHLGHREAVRGLFQSPGVREVRVLPAASPPHKPASAKAQERLEMARLAFSQHPELPFPAEVEVDARELERAAKEPGKPSYTYDSLLAFHRDIPREKLAFVIGSDQLSALHGWYRFPELLGLAHWIVLNRRGEPPNAVREAMLPLQAAGTARLIGQDLWALSMGPTQLRLVSTDAPAVSSTRIREAIGRTGRVPADSVIPPVAAYLKLHRIYGTESGESNGN
jgi:nicotinate-nucleotide adenylyltransferase